MKRIHYNQNIRKVIDPNSNGSIILSKRFVPWKPFIKKYLGKKDIEKQDQGVYDLLVTACMKHAHEHAKPIVADSVVVGVHMLYAHMHDWDSILNGNEEQMRVYTDKLMQLLRAKRSREQLGIVAFETPRHYATGTASLLEQGLIDQVFFTESSTGKLITLEDAASFEGRKAIVIGGYNDSCLMHSMIDLEIYSGEKNILSIPELCLNEPYRHDILQPTVINRISGVIPSSRYFSLNAFMEQYSLQN